MAILNGKLVCSSYLLKLLTGIKNVVFNCVDASAHGTRKIDWEDFENMIVPVPPLTEQYSICFELDAQLSNIDDLVFSTKSSIELLQERRSALISAAVTGKIDVRDWRPPTSSAETEPEHEGAVS